MAEARKNFYRILGLNPYLNHSDQQIAAVVEEKLRLWNRRISVPIFKKYHSMQHEIKAVMLAVNDEQPEAQKAEGDKGRNDKRQLEAKAEIKALEAWLDDHLAKLEENAKLLDSISAEEKKSLVGSGLLHLRESDIADEVFLYLAGACLKTPLSAGTDKASAEARLLDYVLERMGLAADAGPEPGPPQKFDIDRDYIRGLATSLEVLNKKDLFDFLGLSPSAGAAQPLKVRVENDLAVLRKSRRVTTAEGEAEKALLEKAALRFKDDRGLEQYKNERVYAILLADMGAKFNLFKPSGKINPDQFDTLLVRGLELGAREELVVFFIHNEAGLLSPPLTVESRRKVKKETQVRCGDCGRPNPPDSVGGCRHCGSPLVIACPKCKNAVRPGERDFCCGVRLAGFYEALHLQKRAAESLAGKRLQEAAQALAGLDDIWLDRLELAEAKNLRAAVAAGLARAEKLVKDIEDDRRGLKLIAAGQKLAELDRLSVDYRQWSLREKLAKEQEEVKSLLDQARRATDQLAREKTIMQALKLCVDMDELNQSLPPPMPPGAVRAATAGSRISLEWEPSPSIGGVTYVVVRKKGGLPTGPNDREAQIVADTAACRYDDDDVVVGQDYGYGLSARRGEARCSEMVCVDPLMPIESPRDLSIVSQDQGLKISWRLTGLATVDIYRRLATEKSPRPVVKDYAGDSFLDRDLINGQTYIYTLRARFKGGLMSAPTEKSGVPQTPPRPVTDLTAVPADSGGGLTAYTLSWTDPPQGTVSFILQPDQPRTEAGAQVTAPEVYGGRTFSAKDNPGRYNLDFRGVAYLVPLTTDNNITVQGQPVLLNFLSAPVLTTRRSGHDLIIEWRWAPGYDRFEIVFNYDRPPRDHTDGSLLAQEKTGPDGAAGLATIKNGCKDTIFVAACGVYKSARGDIRSEPALYRFAPGELVKINYNLKIKKSLFGSAKNIRLELALDPKPQQLPTLKLVKQTGRAPRLASDGVTIWSLESSPEEVRETMSFDLDPRHLDGNAYVALFLGDPNEAGSFRIFKPKDGPLKLG